MTAVRWVFVPDPTGTAGSAGTPAPARTPPTLAREPDWDALLNHDYTSIGGTKQTPPPPKPVWPIFLTLGLLVAVPALTALGALWAVVRVASGAWHAGKPTAPPPPPPTVPLAERRFTEAEFRALLAKETEEDREADREAERRAGERISARGPMGVK